MNELYEPVEVPSPHQIKLIDAPPIYEKITIRPYLDNYPVQASTNAQKSLEKRVNRALTISHTMKRRFKWWLRNRIIEWGLA